MSKFRIGQAIAIVGVASSLTLAGTVGAAFADSSNALVAKDGGSAVLTQRGAVTISDVHKPGMAMPMAVANVGGGTWSYGRRATTFPKDRCYSNYVHNSTYHSATTYFGDGSDKNFADPSLIAKSHVDRLATTNGCTTYWKTY